MARKPKITNKLLLICIAICSMGFLTKLFSQSSPQGVPARKEDWAAYMTNVNSTSIGSIIVDLELHKQAPVKQRPLRIQIDIKLQKPDKNGLYSPQEAGIIGEIDEKIQIALTNKLNSIYAGHLINDGHLYLFHYLKAGDNAAPFIDAVMAMFPKYQANLKVEPDEEWKTYLDLLYPEPIQMQSIQNSRLVETLRSHGDILDKPRKVDHWVYFALETDREKFLSKIAGKGFKIESKNKINATDGRPFQLHISRIDKVSAMEVDDYVLDLWQIAQDCNGQYDGWETSVIKK